MTAKESSFNRGWNDAIQGLSRASDKIIYIAKIKAHLQKLPVTPWQNGVLAAIQAYQKNKILQERELVA